MSKKKVLLRGVFINRDTNGEGVLKVGTTLIRVSTVMGILYYDGLSEKEIHYIDEARIIGRTEGNSKRLSDLCHKAYADYATGAISEMAYNKIYAVCIDYAYPR